MKVLTLHQPWCSLCVLTNPATGLPYKTIETRGWGPPESLIGQRIALQAAKKVVYGPVGEFRCEPWFFDVQHVADCYCEGGEVDYPCQRGATRIPCLTRVGMEPIFLPLGAILSTVTLVDVVPIVAGACGPGHAVLQVHADCLLGDDPFGDPRINRNFTTQRPYGDFRPGRYAWLLDDAEPVDPPVLFRGGQGLSRSWEP